MTKLQDIVDKNLPPFTIVQIGSDSELTKDVQTYLQIAGLYTGSIDGIYGRQTDFANTRFCQQNWLNCPKTGLYGKTWAIKLLESKKLDRTEVLSKQQAEHVFQNPIYPSELLDLNSCLVRFQITTAPPMRHFMSQVAHESGGLRWLKELASGDDYEWRSDLGNNQAGDGRRFKGAGAIQLTGRANYQAFSSYIGDPKVMDGCDYVAQTYPFTSAGFWWMNNQMNSFIDQGATVREVTRRVNGGYNGLDDRVRYYQLACEVI